LPFHSPERLVLVGQASPKDRETPSQFSFRNFADLRGQTKAFERLAAHYSNLVTLTGQGEAVRLRGGVATADLFPLLGALPALGRTFHPEEDSAGGGPQGHSAILSSGERKTTPGGDERRLRAARPRPVKRSLGRPSAASTFGAAHFKKFNRFIRAMKRRSDRNGS
jgi:hypothetical protein